MLDHLITANDEAYISDDTLSVGRSLFETARRLLNGYMNYLQRAYRDASSNTMRETTPLYQIGEEELVPFPEMAEG